MSKTVDTELINARKADREAIVREGLFIESLEAKDLTPEDLVSKAKKALNVEDNDLIQLHFENNLVKQNLQTTAFIALNNFNSKAESTGLFTAEELESTKEMEKKAAERIAALYDLDVEDLYSEDI